MAALPRRIRVNSFWRWLKRHGNTLLFTISVVTLAVLVSWWALFLYRTIKQERVMRYESMRISASALAYALVHTGGSAPLLGPVATDERLAIATRAQAGPHTLAGLAPLWPDLCIVARPEYLQQLKEDYEAKKAMVLGESGFMLIAVVISAFMLHRVTWLERRSYREMRQFWSRVTHELKTPITGIKAFLQTLQSREFSRAELMPLLGLALREVERQEMLAENLLVGQRLERGGPGLTTRVFAPGPFLREFLEGHRIFLPDSNIGYSAECPDSLQVRADPDAVRVILENLADNALKYGGADPQIRWALRSTGGKVEISVTDSGMGFTPGQGEEMFEAYQRLSEHHTSGRHGTGMGLYISRQLARRMGGNLTASSTGPGQGATFTLTLRVAE